jgi:hypothetical protein
VRSFASVVMLPTTIDVPRDKWRETTAAALRLARGVPQAGFAAGSFPAVVHLRR